MLWTVRPPCGLPWPPVELLYDDDPVDTIVSVTCPDDPILEHALEDVLNADPDLDQDTLDVAVEEWVAYADDDDGYPTSAISAEEAIRRARRFHRDLVLELKSQPRPRSGAPRVPAARTNTRPRGRRVRRPASRAQSPGSPPGEADPPLSPGGAA